MSRYNNGGRIYVMVKLNHGEIDEENIEELKAFSDDSGINQVLDGLATI